MATLRSDIIIPEIFTPYLVQETTKRDAFLASGVVQPMAELNATEDGGDYINVPFFAANLNSTFERLTDSTSLTPGKITADKQRAAGFIEATRLNRVILRLWLLEVTPWLLLAKSSLRTSRMSARKICCLAAQESLAV